MKKDKGFASIILNSMPKSESSHEKWSKGNEASVRRTLNTIQLLDRPMEALEYVAFGKGDTTIYIEMDCHLLPGILNDTIEIDKNLIDSLMKDTPPEQQRDKLTEFITRSIEPYILAMVHTGMDSNP